MKYLIFGDAQSPHLIKWGRALYKKVDLYVASSRAFPDEWDLFLSQKKRHTFAPPKKIKTAIALLRFSRWIREIDPDVINPHYITSHGILAVLAKKLSKVDSIIIASAWGSDILVTPKKNIFYLWLTKYILAQSSLFTSDSNYMTREMGHLGANDIMTFPFGMEKLPSLKTSEKQTWRFFSNRALELNYRPLSVLKTFKKITANAPGAILIIANKGSLEGELKAWVKKNQLSYNVIFVGYLNENQQIKEYRKAQWYFSLPISDSISVSIIEAMAHGCIPILSNLPANRELISHRENGLLGADPFDFEFSHLKKLLSNKDGIMEHNHNWVANNGIFEDSIEFMLEKINNHALDEVNKKSHS